MADQFFEVIGLTSLLLTRCPVDLQSLSMSTDGDDRYSKESQNPMTERDHYVQKEETVPHGKDLSEDSRAESLNIEGNSEEEPPWKPSTQIYLILVCLWRMCSKSCVALC